jgi:hypothetical protein
MSASSLLVTVCADVGSVSKGNFGWWSEADANGITPSELATHVADLLDRGNRVALGFECPLFVPLVADERSLTNARPGEGNRAWSAGAGCGALATGLVQVAWVLREVRSMLTHGVPAYLGWHSFRESHSGLFLWEAFVTDEGKLTSHILDARAGAQAFIRSLPEPETANAVKCAGAVHSLVGAALLRTGWSDDLSLLEQPCLVLRASAGRSDRTTAA